MENHVPMEGEIRTWLPIRVELSNPSVDWEKTWLNLKLKGLDSDQTSFLKLALTCSFTVIAMFVSIYIYICNKIPPCYWLTHQILSNINQLQPS